MSDRDYVLEERGEYRVLLKPEEYAEEPYNYGQAPLLRIDRRWSKDTEHVMADGRPTDDDSRIEEAAARWIYDLDLLEKYLRAYYGTTVFKQYGPNQVTDYVYIVYDTARWRESVWPAELPENYAKTVNMDEMQAWLEGEVYFYEIQKRVHWTTDDPDYDDQDRWEDIPDGTLGSFYGREWAESQALDALENTMREEGNDE